MEYITCLIHNRLSTCRRVDIAGIGSLELINKPAQLVISEGAIIPPSRSIELDVDRSFDEKYTLPPYTHILNLDPEDEYILRESIDSLGFKILNDTSKGDQYEIPSIGSFFQEKGIIKFRQDESSSLIATGKELATIQFTPLKKLQTAKSKVVLPPQNTMVSKLKQVATTLAFVIVTINLVLLGIALMKNLQTRPTDRLPVNLPEGRVNVKPSLDAPLPDAIPIQPDSSSLLQDSSVFLPDPIDSAGQLQSFTPEKSSSEGGDISTQEQLDHMEDKEKSTLPIDNDIPGIIKEKENNKSNFLLRLNATGNDCALIFGAFSNNSNVSKMKAKLEDEGYRVYTEKIASLTRVGIFVPCSNMEKGLKEARQKYNPDAWVFKIKK